MEENKFEKQVQQKMEELKLIPSSPVWENIKNRIEKRKDRKWVLLIFALLFALLLSGGYWLMNSKEPAISKERRMTTHLKKQKEDTVSLNKINATAEKNNKKNLSEEELEAPNAVAQKGDTENKELEKTRKENPLKRKIYKKQNNGSLMMATNSPEPETINLPEKITGEVSSNKVSDESIDSNINIAITPQVKKEQPSDDSLSKNIAIEKAVTKSDDTLDETKSKKPITARSKNKWNFGLFVSGGISHVGNQFPGFGNTPADYLQNPLSTGNTGGSFVSSPSKITSGGGYTAGLFLEKNIFSKTKISFGINYKEFNTSNLVGHRNDTTIAYQASGSSQGRYYNNFKFIELPLQLKVQIGKNKNFSVFWSGGITLSQLVNSNALQFDPYRGIYYKDNSIFNKTQIGLHTGLSTALFQNQKTSILFGPYFYYATSQLANDGLYDKKHFMFFGLHSEIIIKKK
ncbi:MAG: PorT family protein [Bacteroidota bacterium]|nr:PorT family protein [Bacteroidota bacterium]